MSRPSHRKSSSNWIQQPLSPELDTEAQEKPTGAHLFKVVQIMEDGDHRWAVVHCKTNPDKSHDRLVTHIARRVRDVYGEAEIIAAVREQELAEPEASVGEEFDLDAVIKSFRKSLPDPEAEASKRQHLANYRSESAELVALEALTHAYSVRFPVAPQRGKTNANQPILGFDNWGFINLSNTHYVLVLVQVKGTEDKRCPPGEVDTLVKECARVKEQEEEICRALSVLLIALKNPNDKRAVTRMLETLGKHETLNLVIAPVVVRGQMRAHLDDLAPLRSEAYNFTPAVTYGLTVSLEQDLLKFGRAVMLKARSND